MPPEPIRYINGWTGEVVEQTFSNLGKEVMDQSKHGRTLPGV